MAFLGLFLFMVTNPVGVANLTAGNSSYFRYIRKNVTKNVTSFSGAYRRTGTSCLRLLRQ